MNKVISAGVLIGVSIFAACAGKSELVVSNRSTSSSSGVSSASSTSNSAQRPQSEIFDSRDKGGGGGGGGGRNEAPALLASEKITLDQSVNSQVNTAPTDRKIVRNAELNLEADSPEQAQRKITAIAESKGGFVVESQQSSSDTKVIVSDVVSMTVRVPSERFTETIEEVRKTSSRVIVETVKGTDVTEEFIDIEARLKAKKALEQQFVEIMKRANSVEDALRVQSQLADVRGEIEKIEGRRRFLENQASLSTIKVRLQTPTAFASTSSSGFLYRLQQSFSSGFDFALNFVLGLVTLVIAILPFALLIGVPGYLIVRYFVRRSNKTKSVDQIVLDEVQNN